MGEKLTARYPEYEPDAMFRCSRGCGSFRRDRCGVFRGQLHCPRCNYQWTLTYEPAGREALSDKGMG